MSFIPRSPLNRHDASKILQSMEPSLTRKHRARKKPKVSAASFSAALSLLISSLFFKFAPPRSEANGEVERGEVLR